MPKTFRPGSYWLRADYGGDPKRHHALYSGVPKGWGIGFNGVNKADIPPHLAEKVVDMVPSDSQEHWDEFGKCIYEGKIVHLISSKKGKIAERKAAKGNASESNASEKADEKRTTLFLFEQFLRPELWNWPEADQKAALVEAFERKDTAAIGALIVARFAVHGIGFSDFHIIIHDKDVQEHIWDEVRSAYVDRKKGDHIHVTGRYAKPKRGVSPVKAAAILGVQSAQVEIPDDKHAYDNKMAYMIHFKDVNKFQYDASEVITLAGDSYVKYMKEHLHSWEIGRAKKSKKSEEITVDLDWLWEECYQGRVTKENIELTDAYARCYAVHTRKIDDALASYQRRCFARLVDLFDKGLFHTSFIYVQGPSRRGKSALAQNLCEALKYRFGWMVEDLAASNSMDDYRGGDVIFLDDASVSAMTGKAWLNLIDPNEAHPMPGRFHNKPRIAPRVIVLTTTKDPIEYFAFASQIGGDRNEALTQFIARILRAATVIDYRDYWGRYAYPIPGTSVMADPAFYNMRIEAPVPLREPVEHVIEVEDHRTDRPKTRGYLLDHELQPVDDLLYSPIGAMLRIVHDIEVQNKDVVVYGTDEDLVRIMGEAYIQHIEDDKAAEREPTVMMPADFALLPPSIPRGDGADGERWAEAEQKARTASREVDAERWRAEAEMARREREARLAEVRETQEYADAVATWEAAKAAWEVEADAFAKRVERLHASERFKASGLVMTRPMELELEQLRREVGVYRGYASQARNDGDAASKYSNWPQKPSIGDFLSGELLAAYNGDPAIKSQDISIDSLFDE